jgi:hypothetical protein
MLPPHVEGLIDDIRRNKRFEIVVRTYEGEGYASLGHDLIGLDAVIACVGIAEVAASYWTFPSGAFNTYSPNALAEFGAMISGRKSPNTWIEAFTDQDHWLDVYMRVEGRRGGYWTVGDGEILRVELIDLYKENPTIKKILVTGFAAAQIFLAGCFGGTQVMKERAAQQCRQEYVDYGQHVSDAIFRQARLEGRFTEQHEKALQAIQDTVKTGIAACGSKMDRFQVGVKVNEKGVDLGLTVTAANEPKGLHP